MNQQFKFDNAASGSTIQIAGRWAAADSGETIDVIAPSTGEVVAKIAAGGEAEIDRAVAAAREAFERGAWGRLSAVDRGRLLMKFSLLIAENAEELAQLEALDCGKPMKQARADIAACARYFEFYAGAADKVHGETLPFMNGYTVMTLREAKGVTGHIIAWNYPAQMYGRTIGASLAMGNATVIKPAEEACLTPIRLTQLALEAGLPEGAINLVTGYGEKAGAALSAHPGIDFMSFTGSPQVGTLIQQACAINNVGCTMELGGKSPQILFDDADLDKALPFISGAIVQNGGQTCSAGSRLLIHRPILDKVLERVTAKFESLVAAPHDEDADLGALVSAKQKARVQSFLDHAADTGIKTLATGRISPNAPADGFYVAPRVLGLVPPEHRLAREEVFGPVLAVSTFEDEADAVRIANGTDYGLVAGIWTNAGDRQMRMARKVRAGQVYVNGYGAGGGIELPFGGVKKSGHGREKGFEALYEFSELKTVVFNHGE
ncbi:aldehyde dehydrogenase family protein [Aurantimonas sp. E1-2-R+4]|uniref:aldehyde dehydrogenase family protein n=1 Tax=Aurantimonas sp. E1-2-R+4 TaxID=3113714 RepID=UPI003FA5F054